MRYARCFRHRAYAHAAKDESVRPSITLYESNGPVDASPKRAMRSGNRELIVERGPALIDLEAFVKPFRGRVQTQ